LSQYRKRIQTSKKDAGRQTVLSTVRPMTIIVQPHKDLSTSIFQMLLFFLKKTQLSQLGTEIGVFDSASAVSFHHKAMYLTDGYIPSAAG